MNLGRVAAVLALIEVEQGSHVEDALAQFAPPGGPDRGLAWFVALGVLRRRSHVDAALRPHLERPIGNLDPAVRAVLRMGAFEKLFARTPPHAVVNEAVNVAQKVGAGRAKGLVNAVLRRVSEPSDLSRAEALDHPQWLLDRWTTRYGQPAVDAWCARNNEQAPLAIACKGPMDGVRDAMIAAGHGVRPGAAGGREIDGSLWIDGVHGAVSALPGFAEGAWWVQDPASAAVTELVQDGPVLDACAAPGGKTLRLLSRGLKVTAVDRVADRVDVLVHGIARVFVDANVNASAHDWETGPHPALGTFPTVLVDAPCTGLGTLRRHPEIRWRRKPNDVKAAGVKQRAVLEGVLPHLAAGGALIYAVCSPEPEEGSEVVKAFAEAHGLTIEEERSTAPPTGDEDAFYAARLRKT